MLNCFTIEKDENIIEIEVVSVKDYEKWIDQQSAHLKSWLKVTNFSAKAGDYKIIPDDQGKINKVIFIISPEPFYLSFGSLASFLPEGVYTILGANSHKIFDQIAIAWGLGSYVFSKYKTQTSRNIKLFIPETANKAHILRTCEAIYLVRDLINTPTNDLGPEQLAMAAKKVADHGGASFSQIVGEDLLKNNYPTIYAVGKGSANPPRLIDIQWGDVNAPKITLVGKGVCFDTGGLDIKPSAGMRYMKKDMGGAAHVLGLAQMIMSAKLPLRLRVLIPAVENAVSGSAYLPGDVIKTRKGLTVEITNTDAEGRLILCDALYEAIQDKPELLIDIATLTGAARVALGTDVAALFCNRDELADDVLRTSETEQDPMWRLPLYKPYRKQLESPVADLVNASFAPYSGGAIIAALYLNEFVTDEIPWLHFDIMGWNVKSRAGQPEGGEATCIRTLFRYLQNRYS